MLVGRDEGLEVQPRPPGDAAQRGALGGGKVDGDDVVRAARPAGDERGGEPHQGDRGNHGEVRPAAQRGDDQGGMRSDEAAAHHPHVRRGGRRHAAGHLGRGGPFEQVSSGHQADQGADDGVAHQPRLVGEEEQVHRAEVDGPGGIVGEAGDLAARRDPAAPAEQLIDQWQQRGQVHRHGDHPQPDQHPGGGEQTDGHKQPADQGDRGQAAAQVVDHLPPPQAGQPGATGGQPGQQLPVAARPAVLAGGGHGVGARVLLDHLDVGDQTGTQVVALQQIMAEHGVVGDSPVQLAEGDIDVVDPLAGERALAEEILVHVGHGEGIGIEAARGGVHPLQHRAVLDTRQRRADPRLEDAVATADPAAGMEPGLVQRVGDLAHQAAGCLPRQTGVAVQGQHVLHRAGQLPLDRVERRVGGAAQPAVQLVELASLALPPHPRALGAVVDPPAVEQQEARPVQLVEPADPAAGPFDEGGIAGGVFAVGGDEVGHQGEVHLAGVVGQMVDLQVGHEGVDLIGIGQQAGDGDQGTQLGGHTVAQGQAGEQLGRHQPRDGVVHRAERHVAQAHGGDHPDGDHHRGRLRAGDHVENPQGGGDQCGEDQRRGTEIAGQAAAPPGAHDPFAPPRAIPEGRDERRAALVDQPVADITLQVAASAAGTLQGGPGDVDLLLAGSPSQPLDLGAVPVARGEVEFGVARVAAQFLLDQADVLEPVLPVHVEG